jgi:hypothetical protein
MKRRTKIMDNNELLRELKGLEEDNEILREKIKHSKNEQNKKWYSRKLKANEDRILEIEEMLKD